MLALPLESMLLPSCHKQQQQQQISASSFLSGGIDCRSFQQRTNLSRHRVQRLPVVTATVKRTKDYVLDKVVEREKKVKLVIKVKNILVKQPGRVMSLRDLGRYRHYIGLPAKRRFVSLLRKFPGVFVLFEEGAGCVYCRLTASAEAQYKEEIELRKQLEDSAVFRLRKLLMMSVDRRILVAKIVHLRHDLGLGDGFHTRLTSKYPEFFKLVDTAMGPALEVTEWDPDLAVTLEQKKLESIPHEDYEEITVSGRVPKFPRLTLPKGYKLPRREKEKLVKFQQVTLISPYEDARSLNPASKQAEKRAVALVQELLHLTLEKKTLVDHLTHFRSDFKFSQRVRGMLIRHPEIFYVSFKGQRDSVFLREAYDDNSQLLEKDPLVLAKEKLAALVKIDKAAMKVLDDSGGESGGESGDDGGWSDDEDMSPETREFLEERRRRREVMIALKPKVEPW